LALAVSFALLALWGCSRKPQKAQTYPLGERVQVGRLAYTVYETQWLTRLGEGLKARIPQHRFFLVRLSALNHANRDLMVPALTLEDDRGNTYAEVTNGEGVPQWIGFLRQVKPGKTLQGNIAFDAPPGHYKLRLADEDEELAAYIDIPLSFGADAPELPGPGMDTAR
jgi:hypothetical protein